VHRFHLFWIVGACFAIGCSTNIATPPLSQNQSQVRGALTSATSNRDVHASAAPRITISEINAGMATKALFRGPSASAPLAIHNGSELSIDVQADSGVTSVLLSGDALTPMLLQRSSSGHWQGSFQYWDASNRPNSQSEITVRLDSARSSIKRTISVTTLHDS